jgi:DNA-binding NarL/FixJ family response regulator
VSDPLRVLVVDDHDVVQWGFRLMLAEQPWIERCLSARSGERVRVLISGAGRISPSAARAAGASGFVPKEWPAREIAEAVRLVGRGMTVFRDMEEEPATRLSEREREVLELIASGATNREIADRLYLSPWTVKEYTGTVYRKLSVRNRAEAVQRAQRLGLLV